MCDHLYDGQGDEDTLFQMFLNSSITVAAIIRIGEFR